MLFYLIRPYQGDVLIDGVDVKSIPLKRLRKSLSIIPQDPTLFSGSLRYNLDPFGLYTDEMIWQSLKDCGLTSVEDLDREVSESGKCVFLPLIFI